MPHPAPDADLPPQAWLALPRHSQDDPMTCRTLLTLLAVAASAGAAEPVGLIAQVNLLEKGSRPPATCAFFDHGQKIAFAGGGALGPGVLMFWDVVERKPIKAFHDHIFAISSIAVSPDGKKIATGGGYGEVKVWDLDGKVRFAVSGRAEYTYGIAFSPDGKLLAHSGGPLTVRETKGFDLIPAFAKPKQVGPSLSFSPTGKHLAGTGIFGRKIRFYLVEDWTSVDCPLTDPNQECWTAVFTPDGKSVVLNTRFVNGNDQFAVEAWTFTDNKLGTKRFVIPGWHQGICFSPDSKWLFLGESHLNVKDPRERIRVFDMATGKEIVSWVVSQKHTSIRHLTTSPDGTLLVSCDDQSAKVWDLRKILGKHWTAPPAKK